MLAKRWVPCNIWHHPRKPFVENTERSLSLFNKIFFSHWIFLRHRVGCQDDHIALPFKGQDIDFISNLCTDNNCAIVIVPYNLTSKFQSLDITVNKTAKCFISEKYQKWFAEEVANQLNEEKNPVDVDVTLKLSEVRSLQAKWTIQMFEHLKTQEYLIFNGFE